MAYPLLFRGITLCILQQDLFFFLKDPGKKATPPLFPYPTFHRAGMLVFQMSM